MGEYLKVEGHQDLVRDTRTGAILNKNKNAYHSYKKRVQEAQKRWQKRTVITKDLELRLIGPLQSNKVKEALSLFDIVNFKLS